MVAESPASARFPGPPPRDAIAFFEQKRLEPAFDYRDVWREEHAAAFTVAKAMDVDVLSTIHEEVRRALAEGVPFDEFQKTLEPRLKKLGWWGRQEQADPRTGEVREVQLGSPRRLRTIYQANLRTARAAGQWQRIQRTKAAFPFLVYELGPSEKHRPEHAAWHGLMLPVDDPWWQEHMPPNGWGCKCRVRQVSAHEARRLERDGMPGTQRIREIDPDTGRPTGHVTRSRVPIKTQAPPPAVREWQNNRTGQVERVPVGIDPGWDTNPGAVSRRQFGAEVFGDKVAAAPAPVGAAAWSAQAGQVLPEVQQRFEQWVDELAATRRAQSRVQVVGALSPAVVEALRMRGLPVVSAAVTVGDREILHMLRSAKATRSGAVSLADVRRLPQILATPQAVLYDTKDPALLYVFAPATADRVGKIVVRTDMVVQHRAGGGRVRQRTNSVRTAGLVALEDLASGTRYEVVEGEL